MDSVDDVFRYVPVIAVLVVAANVAIFWRRALRLSALTPEKEAGFHTIVRALGLYPGGLTLLWSIGAMLGVFRVVGIPSAASVMEQQKPAAFDWLFLLAWGVVALQFSFWLYVRGGAAFLVAHREIFNSFPRDPRIVKVLWAVLLLASFVSALPRFVNVP